MEREDKYYIIRKCIEKLEKICNPEISSIIDRALSGKELYRDHCIKMLESEDPLDVELVRLCADYIRWTICDDYVTFICNRNINFTNICIVKCRFCSYSVPPDSSQGYTYTIDDIRRKVIEGIERYGITEVCIQGGINPYLTLDYYINILRTIKSIDRNIHIHAFSPQEIYYISSREGMRIRDVLKTLKEAGLDSMPGTAAEVLHDDVRKILCPNKISTDKWIEIIKEAHSIGIRTTCTLMYGHVERVEHVARHLEILKNIQKETGGFTELVLLPFVYQNTKLYEEYDSCRPGSSSLYDIKICAVSRIYLSPYIKNIQVSWVKLGRKLAQYLLTCGANDLGGTLIEEYISHSAGAFERCMMSREEFIELISNIGRIPAERTTSYRIIRIYSHLSLRKIRAGIIHQPFRGTTGSSPPVASIHAQDL